MTDPVRHAAVTYGSDRTHCGLSITFDMLIGWIDHGVKPQFITCPDCRERLGCDSFLAPRRSGVIRVAPSQGLHFYEATVRFMSTYALPNDVEHSAIGRAIADAGEHKVFTELKELPL